MRKLISVLAGEASAFFSLKAGLVACFDCRISQLPSTERVVDYFRWRNEDANRNTLNAHCYWMLRKLGHDATIATAKMKHLTVAAKNELLFQNGINFNDTPAWQRRGCGLVWGKYERPAVNLKTGEKIVTTRRHVQRILELPMKDAYSEFVSKLLT